MCWHLWSKWEVKREEFVVAGGWFIPKEQIGQRCYEEWQEKRCEKCGKTKRALLMVGGR